MGRHIHRRQVLTRALIHSIARAAGLAAALAAVCRLPPLFARDARAKRETAAADGAPSAESPEKTRAAETSEASQNDKNAAEENLSAQAESPPKAVDIPFADEERTRKERERCLSDSGIKRLSKILDDGERYRLYVRARLKEKGLPAYLEYLPVVESSYKTTALSRTGALGLWQFMPNSVKPFLRMDDFVDERLDPWKSTDAAIAKLADNFAMFNDWPLAIAAYNCGAGALKRAMRKNPGKDFWALARLGAISEQSALYVPRLFAIADVCMNAAHYGVEIPGACGDDGEPLNPRAGRFDYIQTDGSKSLRRLASELKIDGDYLASLNPALRREITPPSKYEIRVPEGMGRAAEIALSKIPAYRFQTKYKVQEGDSLWKISRSFHVTLDALCAANAISEDAILKIGKILYIPEK